MSELIASNTIMEQDNVDVKKFYQKGRNYIHFHFKEKFTYKSSIAATNIWKAQCDKNPNQKFVHIWDCQNMHGFDKSAKDLWMEYLNNYLDQTEKIILVADNIVIRGAARIMSRFTKHDLCVYKTLSEMTVAEL